MSDKLILPDVGDGVSHGTVLAVLIKEGDQVSEGQIIMELETDKAVVDIPANASGTVSSVLAKPDSKMQIGEPIALLSGGVSAPVPVALASAAPAVPAASSEINITLPNVGDNIEGGVVAAVLVKAGDAVSEGQVIIELETDKAVVEVPSSASGIISSVAVESGSKISIGGTILIITSSVAAAALPTAPKEDSSAAPAVRETAANAPDGRLLVAAAPSVRRLARELGVDISKVKGTGASGRITAGDVRSLSSADKAPDVAKEVSASAQVFAAAPAQVSTLPDFAKWGSVRREDMSGIRKATVRSMTQAWTTIPMVTHFDKADVTLMEETRKRFGARVEKAGGKLTMTHILMKVVANALRKYPKFNASIDTASEQVVFKDYVNIGVAVDTPVGLLVPVLKDADKKSITEMVIELAELAAKARDRKLKPDEMQGATFTISNLGGIGGHAFTPIVNPPEVAILGVSRGGLEPVWNKEEGAFEPRNMLPVSLSYDHRLIDGADAARFVRFICESLEDPFLISL